MATLITRPDLNLVEPPMVPEIHATGLISAELMGDQVQITFYHSRKGIGGDIEDKVSGILFIKADATQNNAMIVAQAILKELGAKMQMAYPKEVAEMLHA